MKKLHGLFFYLLLCITVTSCFHNNHDINITYKEDDQYYSMNAHFPGNRTREVEEYMDSRIGNNSSMSFTNSRIDGDLTMDDRTTFYIKKYPGVLEIKFDKNKNSGDSYRQIKSMCQGIKKSID